MVSPEDKAVAQVKQQIPINPKILVVDDEKQVLDFLNLFLKHAGYSVSTARTGHAAITKLATDSYDLVILDLGLPDVDAFEVLSVSRRHSPAPKVIVVSGFLSDTRKRLAAHLGAAIGLAKPFDMDEMLLTIRTLLKNSS